MAKHKPWVKHIRIQAGTSGESFGKSFGRAFDGMLEFIKERQLTRLEVFAERVTWVRGRGKRLSRVMHTTTDRLVLHLPDPKHLARMTAGSLPKGRGPIVIGGRPSLAEQRRGGRRR